MPRKKATPPERPKWTRLVHPSPWLEGVDRVVGVVAPGRRLSDPRVVRRTRWSASGVQGVTPPGRQAPGQEPGIDWAKKKSKDRLAAEREGREHLKGAQRDPTDLKAMVAIITEFVDQHVPTADSADAWAALIRQSHNPFEIVVGYTILGAILSKKMALRRRYGAALDRGAKTYFNLARRLSPKAEPPRGLVVETLDALFFDLPTVALALPFAFVTAAFLRTMELLRTEHEPAAIKKQDEAIAQFAHHLHTRFIGRRSLGDHALRAMFPWDPPEWVLAATEET
ncbi:MAG: hypothetical protein IPK13_09345 [Deltaproteobacteria bacterium]|nr:hypothetical protein [Deltaproteobacteria bacterium]